VGVGSNGERRPPQLRAGPRDSPTPFFAFCATHWSWAHRGEELTARGGEGMVVKPLEFAPRGPKGLVQPAVKCRGRE
jgi:hypothetical protein